LAFDRWLAVAEPHLAEPLFGPQAVARLRTLARWLPSDGQAILEARLGDAASSARKPVDLSLRVEGAVQARALAAQPLPPHLQSFLRRWSEPGGPFAAISQVWLEFDLESDPLELPVPAVSARLAGGPSSGEPVEWLLDSLWPALRGRPLSDIQRDLVRFCCREIPASGRLLYLFDLLSRGTDAIRLEIAGLDSTSLVGYLRRVAPRTAAAAAAVAPLFAGVGRIHLSLDIAAEVLPRIGIEGSFPRRPERQPRWRELFDRLVAAGLCTPAERDAALVWSGIDSYWTAAERWPLAEAGIQVRCLRGLSHLKVVCSPGRAPEAKVYLTLGPLDGSGAAGAAASASSPASLSARST
jgi:hypothetical protein